MTKYFHKSISVVSSLRVRYLYVLLVLQVLILITYIVVIDKSWKQLLIRDILRLKNQEFIWDEPSYLMFNFSSLYSILDNHRSIGLPLLIKIYQLIFDGYQYWPYFQFVLYIASVFFLFWSLIRFGFDKILSFLTVSLLLWNLNNYIDLNHIVIMSEVPALAFLNLTVGTLLFALTYQNWKTYMAFAFSLFFLYQIRTNLSYVTFLAPVWAGVFSTVSTGFSVKRFIHVFLKFAALSIVPLFLFGLLRLFVVGQFGFSTKTGGELSGHATHYLDEKNLTKLSGESRAIGEKILQHKRQLNYTCNLSPSAQRAVSDLSQYELESYCFFSDLAVAWHEAIKYQTGIGPFEDPEKNIEPWKYTLSLSSFHSKYYHSSTDKLLMNFSKEILIIEWRQYFSWLWYGGLWGLKFLFMNKTKNLLYVLYIFFAIILQILIRILVRRRSFDKQQFQLWQRQILSLSIVGISYFLFGYILLILFNTPYDRMFITLTPFLLPTFVLWAIPPIWLKTKTSNQPTNV